MSSLSPTPTMQRKSYVPVPVDMFEAGSAVGFALYVRDREKGIQLARRAGEAVTGDDKSAWRMSGVRVLYVDTSDHRAYQQYAESAMDRVAGRGDLPTGRKAELCYQTTRELIRDAVDVGEATAILGERREKWVDNLVTLLLNDEAAVESMLSMLSHDYYTYTHMVNVSVMVALLAWRLGERDRERLKMLSSGGLLHDVGKLRVNPDTLNKTGRLTGEEWEELRSHPDLGLGVLHGRRDIGPTELLMVHQHHEKLDGSGYPLGLLKSEIAVEAQMTAVVDIYDALTCKRPYRAAMPLEKALAILAEESERKLDREMVRTWAHLVQSAMAPAGGST